MNQQYVMTSFNNLALLLDEALQQMQQNRPKSNPALATAKSRAGQATPPPPPRPET